MTNRIGGRATRSAMDDAALDARRELDELKAVHPQAVMLLEAWWREWYLKAGHKRLGRVLLGTSKKETIE